ncbi:Uncharacterised protein [[Clostridium] sordellii]|nr:Uncharacterised protein [[Clostridium] sordellii] [Paeniclostridium sordellii]
MKRKSDNLLKYLYIILGISVIVIAILMIQTKSNSDRIDKLVDVIIGMVSSSVAVLVPMIIFLREKEHEKGQNIENLMSLLEHIYSWIYPRYSIIFRDRKGTILSAVKEPNVPLLYDDSWRNYIADIKNPEEKKFLVGFFITLEQLHKDGKERNILRFIDDNLIKYIENLITSYGNKDVIENIKRRCNSRSAEIYNNLSKNNSALKEYNNMKDEVEDYINTDIEEAIKREEYEEEQFKYIEEHGGKTLVDKIIYAYKHNRGIGTLYTANVLDISIEDCDKVYEKLISDQHPEAIHSTLGYILELQNKEKMADLERVLEEESIIKGIHRV